MKIFATLDGLVLQHVFFDRPDETRAGIEELRTLLRRLIEDSPSSDP